MNAPQVYKVSKNPYKDVCKFIADHPPIPSRQNDTVRIKATNRCTSLCYPSYDYFVVKRFITSFPVFVSPFTITFWKYWECLHTTSIYVLHLRSTKKGPNLPISFQFSDFFLKNVGLINQLFTSFKRKQSMLVRNAYINRMFRDMLS